MPPGLELGIGAWVDCPADHPPNQQILCGGADYTNAVGDALFFAPQSAVLTTNPAPSCAKPATASASNPDGTFEYIAAAQKWAHGGYNTVQRHVGGADNKVVQVEGKLRYRDDPNIVVEIEAWADAFANYKACRIRTISTVSKTPPSVQCTC